MTGFGWRFGWGVRVGVGWRFGWFGGRSVARLVDWVVGVCGCLCLCRLSLSRRARHATSTEPKLRTRRCCHHRAHNLSVQVCERPLQPCQPNTSSVINSRMSSDPSPCRSVLCTTHTHPPPPPPTTPKSCALSTVSECAVRPGWDPSFL